MKCQRCGQASEDGEKCASCGLVYSVYEKEKQQRLGQVYSLINDGDLEGAKKLAQASGQDFPDKRGDFLLLLSNINRDISIVAKYEQAGKSFAMGDYNQTLLLLRNIKAFDQVLDGKVISLRRKAERIVEHEHLFSQAVNSFKAGRIAQARAFFTRVKDVVHQKEVAAYLQKIEAMQGELLRKAVDLLKNNQVELAGIRLRELLDMAPEMEKDIALYLTVVEQKQVIKSNLMALAAKAREEGRLVEAKALYTFLGWQWPDLLSRIRPYADEIGPRALLTLRDAEEQGLIHCDALELTLDQNGFFVGESSLVTTCQQPGCITPVEVNPEPLADSSSSPVDIDGESVADFQ